MRIYMENLRIKDTSENGTANSGSDGVLIIEVFLTVYNIMSFLQNLKYVLLRFPFSLLYSTRLLSSE